MLHDEVEPLKGGELQRERRDQAGENKRGVAIRQRRERRERSEERVLLPLLHGQYIRSTLDQYLGL